MNYKGRAVKLSKNIIVVPDKNYKIEFLVGKSKIRETKIDGINLGYFPKKPQITQKEMLEMYLSGLDEYTSEVQELFKFRDKIYAHSDLKTILEKGKNITSEFSFDKISELIDFVSEISGTIHTIVTDYSIPNNRPENVADWKDTLFLVRIGLKYQEKDCQETVKKGMKRFKDISN